MDLKLRKIALDKYALIHGIRVCQAMHPVSIDFRCDTRASVHTVMSSTTTFYTSVVLGGHAVIYRSTHIHSNVDSAAMTTCNSQLQQLKMSDKISLLNVSQTTK